MSRTVLLQVTLNDDDMTATEQTEPDLNDQDVVAAIASTIAEVYPGNDPVRVRVDLGAVTTAEAAKLVWDAAQIGLEGYEDPVPVDTADAAWKAVTEPTYLGDQ